MGMDNNTYNARNEAGNFESPLQVHKANQGDYTFLDFTNNATAQQERARGDARLGQFQAGIDDFAAAAQQGAALQATKNVRGVGDAFAQGGGLNSGAASAAFADAALSPYYQAQQQIGAMRQQAGAQAAQQGAMQDNAFYDRYTGVAAPITQQGMSDMEKRTMVGNNGKG